MLQNAGVISFYHVLAVDVEIYNNSIKGVLVQSKSGLGLIRSKLIIDATGDADIAYLAGLNYEKGFGKNQLMKPPTLMFKISGVDSTHDRIRISLPKKFTSEESFAWLMALPEKGEYTVNAPSGLKSFDSTNIRSLSSGQEQTTEFILSLFRWLKENHPACHRIKLKGIAPQIGIRDSRRIQGYYTLTEKDVLSARKFPEDGIANGVHPIDLHVKDKHFRNQQLILTRCGDYYQIPYACLLPKGIDNMLVAGRSISATFLAQGSLRVSATCMGIGQAAGTAAGLSIAKSIPPIAVSTSDIRAQLITDGAYLGEENNLPQWNLGLAPLPDEIKSTAY
jgi:hypothetical protein